MDICLKTNSDTQQLELRDIENSGTDYFCNLVVKSQEFSAAGRFEFNDEYLTAFLKNLREMEVKFEGEAVLKNYFDDKHITLEGFNNGHVLVSGLLSKFDGDCFQSFNFCFQTDQTVLKPLIDDFDKYLRFG